MTIEKYKFEIHNNIKPIYDINKRLEESYLCVPPYNSINGKWINETFQALEMGDEVKFKGQITSQIILPWRRAYQTVYRYRELSIIKDFCLTIDFSTVAYFQGNTICSYLSLCAIIEGVLLKWQQEDPSIKWTHIKEFNSERINKIKQTLKSQNHRDSWFFLMCNYLENVLNNIFYLNIEKNDFQSIKDGFNRHISLHMKKHTSWVEGLVNVTRLFLIIDIISELYLMINYERYKYLSNKFDLNFNEDLFKKYFDLYFDSSHEGLYNSKYNRILNDKNGFYL